MTTKPKVLSQKLIPLLKDITDYKELNMPEHNIRENLVWVLERQYGIHLCDLGPIIDSLLKLHKQVTNANS